MLTTVRGYYDGHQIVVDELDKVHLRSGDQVVITVLPEAVLSQEAPSEALIERRLRMLEEEKFVRPTGRTVEEIDQYIRELRGHDRV